MAPRAAETTNIAFSRALRGYHPIVVTGPDDDVLSRFWLEVLATPARLAEIRREVADWLHAIDVDEQVGTDVVLTVNEACTNCIEHAYRDQAAGPIRIQALRTSDWVTLWVSDFGTWKSPDTRPSTRGRGLPIMSAMSNDLTVDRTRDGTTVTMTYAVT